MRGIQKSNMDQEKRGESRKKQPKNDDRIHTKHLRDDTSNNNIANISTTTESTRTCHQCQQTRSNKYSHDQHQHASVREYAALHWVYLPYADAIARFRWHATL